MTHPSRTDFDTALEALRSGKIVCLPTESTYGLAVDPLNQEALDALAELKGRPALAPFALIAGDMAQARAWTGTWPDAAKRLAERHWPGPLTLILPPAPQVLPLLLGASGGVGLRVSSHELSRQLAQALGRPITATSANPSGQPAATTLEEARDYFAGALAALLDGGVCAGPASTLVDFGPGAGGEVLRKGPIALPPLDDY